MRPTFHLVPEPAWAASDASRPYEPASLVAEGFVHCTDGEAEVLATGDRHYREDPRPFLVLTIDLERVTAPWRAEDPAGIYPHIHGAVDRVAILDVARVRRAGDGGFLALEPV